MAPQPEECANCGGSIGKLETPHLWQGKVVCSGCFAKLSGEPRSGARAVRSTTDAERACAMTTCGGVVAIMLGNWMQRAATVNSHYRGLSEFGALLFVAGLMGTFGGFLAFFVMRLKR